MSYPSWMYSDILYLERKLSQWESELRNPFSQFSKQFINKNIQFYKIYLKNVAYGKNL